MASITQIILRYEWKIFIRNRFQLWMLLLVAVIGLYSIYYGHTEIATQRQVLTSVMALEKSEFDTYRASFQEHPTTREEEENHDIASRPEFAWFRHGYHAMLPPHDYAALAIGQRDLFRYYYRLTGMSLHYQLFENELANPVNLMVGNFDLSFVITYLFPLLIIAFTFGLFATDREQGTLPLLLIQSVSIRRIVLTRFLFYFAIIVGLALLLSLVGLCLTGNPLAAANRAAAGTWLLFTGVYCAFWFGLMLLVISFRRSSAFSAMAGAGCWLLFLMVIPAVLNVWVATRYPLSSATLADLTRRTSLENEDDEEEALEVIGEFLAHKPELSAPDSVLKENLLSKAYAAFTSLKDIRSQTEVEHYQSTVSQRNARTYQFHWFCPPIAMQDLLAHLGETDLSTFLHFQTQLASFHGQITSFYFSRMFKNQPIMATDYDQLPAFSLASVPGRGRLLLAGFLKLLLAAVLISLLGYFNFNRNPRTS
ncbi:MAG: DUF3526 domain-containing protein [Bacteroidota bacterium]